MRRAQPPLLVALLAAAGCALATAPPAQAGSLSPACLPLDEPIARAAARFALPVALVRAVIAVESNFSVFAVSPKGAMGLMQVMPGTYAGLRLRHALGSDPFDPCDNILAGSAYLREMLDRYGDPGFLAAYNAGPGRYEAYLAGARPLPAETIAYVARVSALIGRSPAPQPVQQALDPDAWKRGNLFAGGARSADENPAGVASTPRAAPPEMTEMPRAEPAGDTLFVPRTGTPR